MFSFELLWVPRPTPAPMGAKFGAELIFGSHEHRVGVSWSWDHSQRINFTKEGKPYTVQHTLLYTWYWTFFATSFAAKCKGILGNEVVLDNREHPCVEEGRRVTSSCAENLVLCLYIWWQWRNFFIHIYASCSGRWSPYVAQGNANILQHLQSDRRSGASIKLFLNRLIQFYLNKVTNLHQLTSHSTTSCPRTWSSYRDHRLLWRHFTLCVR